MIILYYNIVKKSECTQKVNLICIRDRIIKMSDILIFVFKTWNCIIFYDFSSEVKFMYYIFI